MKYLKGVAAEMKKVTWPSARDTNKFTWTVLFMVLILSLYFALTDFVFGNVIDWFIRLGVKKIY